MSGIRNRRQRNQAFVNTLLLLSTSFQIKNYAHGCHRATCRKFVYYLVVEVVYGTIKRGSSCSGFFASSLASNGIPSIKDGKMRKGDHEKCH